MKNKKIGIVSLYGNFNYGNKLQLYAIQETCYKLRYKTEIVRNTNERQSTSSIDKIIQKIKKTIRYVIPKTTYKNNNFKDFENNLNLTYRYYYPNDNNKILSKKYDYFIIGSDQVWNPNFGLKGDLCFLEFVKNKNKIAFSASFGVNSIPKELYGLYEKGIKNLDYISVREDAGKKIIEKITGRKDVEVLVDPTMLLTKKEWQKISKKPNNLDDQKYILNYFLGELSTERKKQIDELAFKHGWKIINILDKNDPFYDSGPSEFVYLEEHAELICTDSFHSCVFGILMETPFIVFDREDLHESMNSRIETLLKKFKLEERKYNGEITKKQLNCNYKNTNEILQEERKKSINFLKKALNLKKEVAK